MAATQFDLSTVQASAAPPAAPQFDMSTVKPPAAPQFDMSTVKPPAAPQLKSDAPTGQAKLSPQEKAQAMKDVFLDPKPVAPQFDMSTVKPPGTKAPGYLERVGTDIEKPFALMEAPFLSDAENKNLRDKSLLPAGPPKTFAQSVNEGPIGAGVGAIYAPISELLAPVTNKATGYAQKKGVTPTQLEDVQAGLNILGVGGLPKLGKVKPELEVPTAVAPEAPTVKATTMGGPGEAAIAAPIFTPDTPTATTKTISTPRGVADELYANTMRANVDAKELGNFMKSSGANKLPYDMRVKFGLHEDDPAGVPLTAAEQGAYDQVVKPMRTELEEAKKALVKKGYDPEAFAADDEAVETKGGAIRQVVGKNTPMDRLLGTQEKVPLKQRIKTAMTPVGKRSLSTNAGVVKPRSMFALDEGGKRAIVHLTDEGDVVDAANPSKVIGKLTDPNDVEVKTDTGVGKLTDATRAEITAATKGKIRYHEDAVSTTATALLQVRRAARVARTLENIAKDPNAGDVVRAPSKGARNIPSTWVEIPGVPAFRGKYFEPRFAEEIEDHLASSRRQGGDLKALESLNRFAIASLFWLNPVHMYNVADAFAVSKGALGFTTDLPATTVDFLKSLKSVATRDKLYMEQARAGVPMRGLDAATQKFSHDLLKAMVGRSARDPQGFAAFAKKFGYQKPVDLIKRIGQLSHDVTFSLQDILQQTLERGLQRQKGMGRAAATEEIAKTFPSYRTPARLMGLRTLGKAMKGSAWFQFPGWDVGRLQGLGNMLKGAASLDRKSLDQLLMIAVMYEFGKQVYDPAIKQLTGNEDAEAPTSGYGVFPKAAEDVLDGDKSISQMMQSLAPLGYIPKAAAKFPIGMDLYTGQKIALPGETPKEIGFDYLKSFGKDIDPIRRLMNADDGKEDIRSSIAAQLGFKVPTDEQAAGKDKARIYNQWQLKSKRKKEPDSIAP